ncbi:peptide transporter family 1-like isoform X1 [Nasonia vitripennis]|uniref:Uncharacterized protein n=2 Tax=Nasonia vitripennis TaxID=7425 RepID=A0A7M7M6U1_NASVI|nr:peptide transporter family 1-like isoform X1 [Nasonia vitripennis]
MLSEQVKGNVSTFPKPVIVILIFAFSIKFSYNSIRGTLPLYLVDTLHLEESQATVFYHAFGMCVFFFAFAGGILADSFFGRYKSLIYYSTSLSLGLVLLTLTAVPMLHFPVSELTILSLIIIAMGCGSLRSCVPAFGGDQFILPQQARQLSLWFVLMCIAHNTASLSVSFIAPVLRKDLTCFGELTCYSLVFIVPTVLMIVTTVLYVVGTRFYRIEKLQENVLPKITKCVTYALYQRIKSSEKRPHWLDHADKKFEPTMIEDIKSVTALLKLFLPLPIFWTLYSMTSTAWTFQASRMNGEFAGYLIKPDQITAVNPVFVIIFVPIFHSYIFPLLAKYFWVNTPLRKITLGGLVLALSYYVSGVIELNLEPTYAKIPMKGLAQVRIFNTLDCNINMNIENQDFVLERLSMWQNISISANKTVPFEYRADYSNCGIYDLPSVIVSGKLEAVENSATSWAITKKGLSYRYTDSIDKSKSGNPRIRALIYIDTDLTEPKPVLRITHNNETLETITLSKKFNASVFKEVAHKSYDFYVNDRLVESNAFIKLGGVYTVVGYASENKTVARAITVTEPNSFHILWILPQQFLLAIAEIMVEVLVMEFAFSQAPVSMKALLQALWLFTAFFGNLIVIVVTEARIFERKAFEIFFYAVLMTVAMAFFATLAKFYRYKQDSEDNLENDAKEETSKNT